ncbi:exodeoxyribonuclease VII large subunit [Pseudohalioglobus sediminis]|uniref:Exodeoxyribonuclease 7 large subunit n=1 Tax=Pseudohalioglobus sediminis TaxID=2606449 RepID=A0A5B0X517_9GAMM|nr:exodeoxyribonuclease VII large subunit [Pseudohalioglobus sediminis]KAA1194406.1 exodeoxyribonuclease VII large subunit [Pseudohalioglobus sediminis]
MTNPFHNASQPVALTVSQLNRQARNLLESHFDFVWVEGEISNLAVPSSGHWYFSLKDGSAQVRCAMFRGRNQRVRFAPENGDHIRLRCRVSLYEGRGEFQLIVEHMELAGAGALQAAFEKLKAKLLAEGLFDSARKRALPEHIAHLGVVTSPTGAAIHDILTVLQRRCPAIEVSIFPVAVQGEAAAGEIAAAIARANQLQRDGKIQLDALIVGRGGGSMEDLWAFNEEIVARAIAASTLPIVSAVGHEVDFTIADMAADQRAATPSAAAEMLSPDQQEQRQRLLQLEAELVRQMRRRLADSYTRINHLRARLKHPGALLREQSQRLDSAEQRLLRAQANLLAQKRGELRLIESRFLARHPGKRVQQTQKELTALQTRLQGTMRTRLLEGRERLTHLARLLDSLSPLNTLSRGYAIVSRPSGAVVTQAEDVQVGDTLTARLARGQLSVTVTDTETSEE